MDVLTLTLLGLVGIVVAVVLVVRHNSRQRALRPATTAIASASGSDRRVPAFVLYGVAAVGVVAGILVGNVPGPSNELFVCPSVFQWNGFSLGEQQLMSTYSGGGCAAHVRIMTLAMTVAFVVAVAAAIVATVLTLAARTSRSSAVPVAPLAALPASPPAWHPIPGQPGKMRWWDGTAWTDHIHDQNPPQS